MKTFLTPVTYIHTRRLAAITFGSALAMALASTAFAGGPPPTPTPAPTITSGNKNGTVGVALSPSYQLTANQAIPNGNWGATGLPPGLTGPSATGVISGTPTTAGGYTVHLTATNANGTGVKHVTFTIAAASSYGANCAGNDIANGCLGGRYSHA
jgi:hypothetical protein